MSDSDSKPTRDGEAPQGSEDDRRHFLKVVGLGGLGAGVAAAVGAPAVVYIAYPLSHQTVSGGDSFIEAGELDRFPDGEPVKVELFADKRDAWNRVVDVKIGSAWVIREGKKLRAFSTVCPHLGCAIDHEKDKFKCPCHRSSFNMEGEVLGGPSPRGMDELEVKTEDGRVAIHYQRFKQGISEKEVV